MDWMELEPEAVMTAIDVLEEIAERRKRAR